jgi:hypothetical protein
MRTSLLFIFVSFFNIANSQTIIPIGVDYSDIKIIDTLSLTSDSVLTKIGYFDDIKLVAECSAYLVPDSIDEPRLPRITRRHFFKKVPVTKIIRHGKTIEYINQYTRVTEYSLGKLLSTTAYDADKNKVSLDILPIKRGQCGETTAEYLVDGTKINK